MKKVLKLDKAIMGTIHVASIVVKDCGCCMLFSIFLFEQFQILWFFFTKVVKTMILIYGGSYIVKGFVLFTANVVECEWMLCLRNVTSSSFRFALIEWKTYSNSISGNLFAVIATQDVH